MSMTRALLVVDVQNDFTEGGALGVEGGAGVAQGITDLLRAPHGYDIVIASRDWHEAENDNGGHFAKPEDEPNFTTTWPVHCVQGTEGAEYHRALDISRIDVHLRKGMGESAYSAFEGVTTDGRNLVDVLREREVDHLDIVGIATDYCVRASALDARQTFGDAVTVRVLPDLVAGVAPDTSVAALRELTAAGVQLG